MVPNESKQPVLNRYAVGGLCTGTALLLISIVELISPGNGSALLLFLGATVIVARVCGVKPGIIVLVLGYFLVELFFIPHRPAGAIWVNAFGYFVVGLALTWMASRRARSQSEPLHEGSEIVKPRGIEIGNPAEKKQEAADAEIESFVYSVSHDLRTPMRAIKGFTNAIREDYGHLMNAEGQEYATRTVEAAEKLEQMLDCLLNYSRIGRGEVELKRVELSECLGKLGRDWAAIAKQREAELQIGPSLPAVVGDSALLEASLTQLVSNALKFTAEGRKPCVRIDTETSNGSVRIKVTDNGIGIDQKHFPKLFQMFQRFNPAEKYPGLGMGLASAEKAAKKMGGRLGAESKTGEGSCFWIEVPKAEGG